MAIIEKTHKENALQKNSLKNFCQWSLTEVFTHWQLVRFILLLLLKDGAREKYLCCISINAINLISFSIDILHMLFQEKEIPFL